MVSFFDSFLYKSQVLCTSRHFHQPISSDSYIFVLLIFLSVAHQVTTRLESRHSTSPFLAYLRRETLPFRFVLVYSCILYLFFDCYLFKLFTGLLLTPRNVFLDSCHVTYQKHIFIYVPRCYTASAYITIISQVIGTVQGTLTHWFS